MNTKKFSFIGYLSIGCLLLSLLLYGVDYLVFRDAHTLFLYLLSSLAFLPLEIFIVVLIIERIIDQSERKAKLQKLNMVLGAFFNDVGNTLLRGLLANFNNRAEISQHLNLNDKWGRKEFQTAADYADKLKIEIDYHDMNLAELKVFFKQKREFLMTLLGNPSLLEHDHFTDLLWAVTHLDEELESRNSVENLPEADLKHLAGDIERLYGRLVVEWLDYIEHLHTNYRFLYSLVLRTHPFQSNPSAVIKK
jgi:hypothetical protein